MKILVAQLGARRHYLVPVALHQAGILDRFVTDFYAGKLSAAFARALPSSLASRAGSRRTLNLPTGKVSSLPIFALAAKIDALIFSRSTSQSRRWIKTGRQFATLSSAYLNHDTTHVFAFTSAAKELFAQAKAMGVRCILDHATAPRRHEMALVSQEHDRFPEWAARDTHDPCVDEYHVRQMEEAQQADLIICNSTFASKTLIGEGLDPGKVISVPLGIGPIDAATPAERSPDDQLHVLYVGGEALRKGVPYLVRALAALSSATIQARFVGNLGLSKHGVSEVARVGQVTGDVPRSQMTQHYAWADVLVLPSVSDTFGLVILEAMAHGVPVIASENTGGPDVIRDGVDGFVVPIRDSEALAARIDQLAREPDTRKAMASNARQRASAFSLDAYRTKLVDAARSQMNARENTDARRA